MTDDKEIKWHLAADDFLSITHADDRVTKRKIIANDDKADKTAVQTALDDKADKTAVQTALDDKADKTALDLKADITALDLKADKTALETINTALNTITTPSSLGTIPTSCGDLKTIGFVKSGIFSIMDNKQVKNVYCDFTKTTNAAITTPSSLGTIPTSCGDLKTIGFVKSGIFSIMDNKQVKNVYCDFTKTTNAELQKMIGTVDVKSTAVYFFAQMTRIYSTALTTISFDSIKLNVGTALNTATGIFVAPTTGKYYFAFSGISDSGVKARVLMQTAKTGTTDWILVGEGYGDTTFKTFSIHATLELVKGDQVRLYLLEGRIHEAVSHNYFNYVGWLVEENELTV
ncbi:hypothetical protein DAPPUDRAFT_101617 [Daphnia pulex]|uniref:C1q domain-containing protein n=1 Tax=Daphnia pulex TaxID=6669 RepID=E9GDZ1_DAPPU|nr:hypothetical protein DAPPUDRAFT_101617 [Daphnia pulex]|eukprot:EFX82173.1 hypothetical protein DAPPUDRAFT_101617 [Daphnia pulex]